MTNKLSGHILENVINMINHFMIKDIKEYSKSIMLDVMMRFS
jgi:hypothetical protein